MLEVYILIFYKIRYILEELYVAVFWIKSQLIIYIDYLNTGIMYTKKLSWNKEMHVLKSNFLSSQMDSHIFSPSSLPFKKAKWVQLKGKTLQVLKNSLPLCRYAFPKYLGNFKVERH